MSVHANHTAEQRQHHYAVEKELANRLRNASKEERRTLYTSLYNELFHRVPDHPALIQKTSPEITKAYTRKQFIFVKRFLHKRITFLEVGAGDCALAQEVCKWVKQVYAIEVSEEITKDLSPPANFKLIISDGSTIPLPKESVDLAYSFQVMEHLHPEDALDQLENIVNVLVKGGKYLCITPNRSNGPHDISKYFDDEATGFHLKEYTVAELSSLFIQAGFSKVKACFGGRQLFVTIPSYPYILLEKFLYIFPKKLRRSVLLKHFLHNRLIGIK
jgi:SAM-dependent methyltransferase